MITVKYSIKVEHIEKYPCCPYKKNWICGGELRNTTITTNKLKPALNS